MPGAEMKVGGHPFVREGVTNQFFADRIVEKLIEETHRRLEGPVGRRGQNVGPETLEDGLGGR